MPEATSVKEHTPLPSRERGRGEGASPAGTINIRCHRQARITPSLTLPPQGGGDRSSGISLGFLDRPDGERIAYHRTPGDAPGVVFLGGFKSDMSGSKALALEAWCRARGRAFLRFDYQGHGRSGGAFTDGSIGRWRDDALAVLDELTEGPQILVGSSMGGWIMLLVALARAPRIAGLIGIAAAADFTEDLIRTALSDAQREQLRREGLIRQPSEYGPDPYPITRRLLDEARDHLLLRGAPLPISCPVRLLHGMRDADVPWRTSLRIAERLEGEDVRITLIKDGEHRLSRDADLELLTDTLAELVG